MSDDTLRMSWSKRDRDMLINYPVKPDGWLLHGTLNREFFQELEKRGYDLTTLRFSIKRKGRG